VVATASALALLCGTSAEAQVSFAGKTMTIYVAGGAGGGVDAYARTLSPFLQKNLPGNPAIVLSNMPGAGGAQAVQYLYNVAPKDGTAIGTTNVGPIADPFLEAASPTNYDIAKFAWIGSLAAGNTVCAAWHATGATSIADAKAKMLTVAATGARSAPTRSALLMNAYVGTHFKPIAGYTGGTALLALERGEVDAICTTLNSLRTTRPDWLREKKLNVLVHVALEADPEYPTVPRVLDFIQNPDDRASLEFFLLPYEFNNPYYLPPGVQPAAVEAWRKAFDAAVADPAYVAEAKKRNQDLTVKSGAQVEALVRKLVSTPPDVIKRTLAAVDPNGRVDEIKEK
jgi:tripartite-type tricarboxylate transporter receptor subunit TctC